MGQTGWALKLQCTWLSTSHPTSKRMHSSRVFCRGEKLLLCQCQMRMVTPLKSHLRSAKRPIRFLTVFTTHLAIFHTTMMRQTASRQWPQELFTAWWWTIYSSLLFPLTLVFKARISHRVSLLIHGGARITGRGQVRRVSTSLMRPQTSKLSNTWALLWKSKQVHLAPS